MGDILAVGAARRRQRIGDGVEALYVVGDALADRDRVRRNVAGAAPADAIAGADTLAEERHPTIRAVAEGDPADVVLVELDVVVTRLRIGDTKAAGDADLVEQAPPPIPPDPVGALGDLDHQGVEDDGGSGNPKHLVRFTSRDSDRHRRLQLALRYRQSGVDAL